VTLGPIRKRPGAAKRSAHAIISIEGSTQELCWTFSQLKNVPSPTSAAIVGPLRIGSISTPLGVAGFVPSGCRSRPAVLLRAMLAEPQHLYVTIENNRHPERGVRGRL
jgi:hypothetical protein